MQDKMTIFIGGGGASTAVGGGGLQWGGEGMRERRKQRIREMRVVTTQPKP